jgi:anti-sigma B factor antagonist
MELTMTTLALAQPTTFVVNVPFAVLDSHTASELRRALGRVVAPARQLVLDLSRVSSIDSAGIGALAGLARRTAAVGGDVKLCGLSKPLAAIAELVRLDRAFEIFATREEAAETLGIGACDVATIDLATSSETERRPLLRRLSLLPSWS